MLWCLSSKTLCILILMMGLVTANCIFARQADFYLHSANGLHSWRGMMRFTPYCWLPVGFLSEGRDQKGFSVEVISELDKDGEEFIGWLWPSPQPCFFTLAAVKPPHSSSWSQFAIFFNTELAALHPIRNVSTNPAILPPQGSEFQLAASFYWASKF